MNRSVSAQANILRLVVGVRGSTRNVVWRDEQRVKAVCRRHQRRKIFEQSKLLAGHNQTRGLAVGCWVGLLLEESFYFHDQGRQWMLWVLIQFALGQLPDLVWNVGPVVSRELARLLDWSRAETVE